MPKERRTMMSDARLARSALSLAQGYLTSELNPNSEGGIEEQKECLVDNYGDAFNAVAEKMVHGSEDVRGLFRIVRKVRSLKETE